MKQFHLYMQGFRSMLFSSPNFSRPVGGFEHLLICRGFGLHVWDMSRLVHTSSSACSNILMRIWKSIGKNLSLVGTKWKRTGPSAGSIWIEVQERWFEMMIIYKAPGWVWKNIVSIQPDYNKLHGIHCSVFFFSAYLSVTNGPSHLATYLELWEMDLAPSLVCAWTVWYGNW